MTIMIVVTLAVGSDDNTHYYYSFARSWLGEIQNGSVHM